MKIPHANAFIAAFLIGCGAPAALAAEPPALPRPSAAPQKPQAAPIAPQAPLGLPRAASVQSGNSGKKLGDDMECLVEPHLVTSLGSPVEGTLTEVLVD